jgi:NADPH:quinone reductase-like Zn-dependent oxidoreductase
MRAIVVTRPGGYDRLVIENISEPVCGPEDVIVSVASIGVNYADCLVRLGLYKSATDNAQYPIVPGFDFSGTISRVGEKVETFRAGDRVYGVTLFGAYQEKVAVNYRYVQIIPGDLSFAIAASLPTAFLTASYILNDLAHIKKGERLLIRSIGGGVGSWLALIAAKKCVEYEGTVSNQEKKNMVSGRLGTHVLLESEIKGRDSYDVIANAKGGASIATDFQNLKPKGRLVLYGFHGMVKTDDKGRLSILSWVRIAIEYLRTPRLPPFVLVNRNRAVFGFNLSYLFNEVERYQESMVELEAMLVADQLPAITELPFSQAAEAHKLIESGKTVGKLVLSF